MALSSQLDADQKDLTLDWLENNVLNHPEYGKQVKKILKSVDPRVRFPELDMEEAMETRTKAAEDKLEKYIAEQKEKENKAFWDGQRQKAKEAGLVDDEHMPAMEKWMVENHLGDYQRAAKLYNEEVIKPAAEPTNYQGTFGVQLPNHEGLFQDPTKWSRNEALKAINDIKKGKY
jgi:hypothetical protein